MKLKKFDFGRILTFDILRGYFLLVILFNHLAYYPNGFDLFTGRGILYVSSAEGFFLVSGIVLGIVRGRKLIDKPFRDSAKLILKRALQLYLAAVILTIIFTLLAWAFWEMPGVKSTPPNPNIGFINMLWQSVTLNNIYGWTDFLRQYAIFIAIAPLAVWLLRRGKWYIVLIASFFIWLNFPVYAENQFFVQPYAWQFIFFLGLIIGFHWPELNSAWKKIPKALANTIGVTMLTAGIVTAIISAVLVFSQAYDTNLANELTKYHREYEVFFDKNRLPIERLALGAIWFWGLFWLVRKFEPWFKKWLGWLLIPLGQNSLYVYIVQGFIVFFFHIFIKHRDKIMTPGLIPHLDSLLLSVLAVAIIWLLVRYKVLFKIIPR